MSAHRRTAPDDARAGAADSTRSAPDRPDPDRLEPDCPEPDCPEPDQPEPELDQPEPDQPEPDGSPTGAPAPGTRPRLPRRTLRVVAVGVLTVVGCAGWYGHRQWDAQAAEALTRADADLRVVAGQLHAARLDGRTVLAESAGRVADNDVRRDLAALLVDLPVTTTDDAASRGDRTRQARTLADDAVDRTTLLVTVTETVRAEHAAWELAAAEADHERAVATLAAAVDDAVLTLAASEGRVLDDAVRLGLAEVVDAAVAVRDAPAPSGTEALVGSSAEALDHVERLALAQVAVAEAEAGWQAEQDREAAEQGAAAAAQAAGSGWAPASSGARTGSSSSGTSSGRTTGGGPAGPSSGGGVSGGTGWFRGWEPGDPVPDGWQVVVESEGGGWGGDEFGNVWVH